MIRSVTHQQTRSWQRAHEMRHKQVWVLIGLLAVIAAVLVFSGYFAGVSWLSLTVSVFHTTFRLIVAYLIALALGVSIGLLVGWSPFADTLFPVFDVLQNVPSFALIPFFIYFFGLDDLMIILFAVSSIIWPVLFAVLASIKNAHADLSDAATIFGARGWRRIPYYLAPLSLPAVLTGSIVGIAIGWEAVIGAEIIAHASGFGLFIEDATSTGVNDVAIAGMLVILLIVFVINRLVWTPLLAESSKRYAE